MCEGIQGRARGCSGVRARAGPTSTWRLWWTTWRLSAIVTCGSSRHVARARGRCCNRSSRRPSRTSMEPPARCGRWSATSRISGRTRRRRSSSTSWRSTWMATRRSRPRGRRVVPARATDTSTPTSGAAANGCVCTRASGRCRRADKDGAMIRLRMSATDLERMRFAYSPLAEVAESLYMVNSGRIHRLHRAWFDMARDGLRRVDMALLRAIVPAPRPHVASFLLGGATDPATTIEQQLKLVADCPADRLRTDLEVVWRGVLPPAAEQLVADGVSGARHLAEVLWQYWAVAIEPHWRQIRAVLDADIAYRAARLARGGIEALLSDLHPELELAEHAIQIVSSRHSTEHDLCGVGLLLVPCVFAWPHIMVDPGTAGSPSITYGPRGIGELWPTAAAEESTGEDALGALLGRSRAAILISVALPKSTTDLARELGQSTPAVSAHLSVLRRSGLVTSWRSGRRVLYQRTPLATSIVVASAAALDIASGSPT